MKRTYSKLQLFVQYVCPFDDSNFNGLSWSSKQVPLQPIVPGRQTPSCEPELPNISITSANLSSLIPPFQKYSELEFATPLTM